MLNCHIREVFVRNKDATLFNLMALKSSKLLYIYVQKIYIFYIYIIKSAELVFAYFAS